MPDNVQVTVDNDSVLGYEKKVLSNIFKLPIMFILTFWVALKKTIFGHNLKTNTFWFDGISPICREIKENAMHWRALDIAYNYKFQEGTNFTAKITNFWLNIKNAQAVRNRLKLVKKELRQEIQNLSDKKLEIRLLSIAAGSAQGVIETMSESKQKGIHIKAIFLDLDPTAIEYSRQMAQIFGIVNQITFINKSVKELEEAVGDFKPNIIEMVGFLDYRPREKAINLIGKINQLLDSGGVTLISNIAPNIERYFLYQVMNWPMIYRSPEQLADVVVKEGFNPQKCEIIYEPLKIHGIAICRKK
jgi:2-polyprenyl-3-methyl-5-hydroxy-6-metoxy-1,4-benzoquinol methylase